MMPRIGVVDELQSDSGRHCQVRFLEQTRLEIRLVLDVRHEEFVLTDILLYRLQC